MNKRKSIISRMMMLSVRKTYPDCLPSFLSFLSSLSPSQQLSPSSLFTQSSSIEISLREIKAFPFVSYASLNNAPLTTTLVCLLNGETEIKSRILFRSFLTSSFFPLAFISSSKHHNADVTDASLVRSFIRFSTPGPFKKLNTINFMTFTFSFCRIHHETEIHSPSRVFSSEYTNTKQGQQEKWELDERESNRKSEWKKFKRQFLCSTIENWERECVDTMEFQVYSFLSRGSFSSSHERFSPSNEPTLNEMRHYNTPEIKCDRLARSFYWGRKEEFRAKFFCVSTWLEVTESFPCYFYFWQRRTFNQAPC